MTAGSGGGRMRSAAWVIAVQAAVEAGWTVHLVTAVDADQRPLAAAVGAGSVVGLTVLALLVRRGRARTIAGLVEATFVGGSVDWLVVFPELRITTAATMALGALALVLLADRRRTRDDEGSPPASS